MSSSGSKWLVRIFTQQLINYAFIGVFYGKMTGFYKNPN